MNPIGIVKLLGCWVCIIGAVVILLLEHAVAFGLPGTLALLAIAFAMAPATW